MQEHMQSMHEHMNMMHSMSGPGGPGMMGGPGGPGMMGGPGGPQEGPSAPESE